MNTTTRNALIGVIIVIIIAVLSFLVWQEKQASETSVSIPTATSTAATSTGTSVIVGTSTTSTGGYTITPITTGSAPKAPDYKTPLSPPAGTSADVQAQYSDQFATIQTTLASSPTDYSSWIQLGILREETGDYQGAAADWNYVTQIYPNDPTAFADLGNLYASYLNQPSQGITYYKDAIKLDPVKEVSFYQNLAQIYLNEGDSTDAKAILQQGITAQVIGYQNLQNMLSSMQ